MIAVGLVEAGGGAVGDADGGEFGFDVFVSEVGHVALSE